MKPAAPSIEAYHAAAAPEVRHLLEQVYAAVRHAAPDAEPCISYGMPAFRLQGALVYYAACRHHIGFYPTPSGILHFRRELARYTTSRGAIQFPLSEPIPVDLIEKMVRFRVSENLQKALHKKKKPGSR